jgi:hypothetical protein
MADENIILHNYSDDSQIKAYMRDVLAPRVFKNVDINALNAGLFSLNTE